MNHYADPRTDGKWQLLLRRIIRLLISLLFLYPAKSQSNNELEEMQASLAGLRVLDGPDVGGDAQDINQILTWIKTDWDRVSKSLPKLKPRDVSGILAIAMNHMNDFEYFDFTIAMLREVENGSIKDQWCIYELLAPNYAKEHFCALNYKEHTLRKALTDVRLYLKNKGDDENVRHIDRILSGSAKGSCDRFRKENLLEPLPTLEELSLTGRKDRDGWTKALAQTARNKKRAPYDPRVLFDFSLGDIILLLCGLGFFGVLAYLFWPQKLDKVPSNEIQ